MHQTVYIDVDEEITGILDRVRQETAMNIFLVVPKGAMLLDSIINLKLLKKEAEKMGKTVSIVAPNDNRARTMIERAGIKAEDYNHAMNEQQNNFTLDDVFNSISEKLIRRHPHVFSDVKVKDSDEVLKNWDKIKSDVEGRKKKSALESIPKSLPPLERAFKIQKKVAKQGFDWDDIESTFDKLHEEIGELKNELVKNRQDNRRISEECGDLLFSSINICRKLNCDPSIALDKTNRKFSTRYNYVENSMKNNNIEMIKENFDKMNLFWEKSKEFEN